MRTTIEDAVATTINTLKKEDAVAKAVQQNTDKERALENKQQKVSHNSYHDMKLIIKSLQKEVNFDKKKHINIHDDFNFLTFNSPHVNGLILINYFNDNDFIVPAANLNVVTNDYEIVIYHQSQDPLSDISLDVNSLLNIMKRLVSLGRHGIYMRAQRNKRLQSKVNQLENKMNL